MSNWAQKTLSQMVDHVDERCGNQSLSLVLSVTERRGIIPQDEVFRKRIATADVSKYKVLQPLDIAYNPYLLWTGAIGQWLGSEPGVTSPVYETFRARGGYDPRFIGLLLSSGTLTPYFNATAIGSISRRRRTTVPVFLDAQVEVPSLDEQRRIVAVISALDGQVKAMEDELQAAQNLLRRTVSKIMADLPATMKFGSVAVTRSGPSWSAADESKTPTSGSLRVVKITNTKDGGVFDMSDETYVTGLPDSTAKLDEASLIIIRTNGNRNRIGNVYRPDASAVGCAVSAFQFISQPINPADRDFLYWTLADPSMQQRMSEAASGTTGLGNLAVRWLNAVEIPWSDDPAERSAISSSADAAERTVIRLGDELEHLRSVRTDLLDALLSQQITVDEAVDQFIEPAA